MYEAQNWIGVYWLDWWDPKFGSRRGNIAVGHEMMPFFLLAAAIAWTIGAAFVWRSMLAASTARVLWRNAAAGTLAATVPFCLSVALHDTPQSDFLSLFMLAVTFCGPGLFAAAFFRRPPAAPTPRAP
jgi:hypothetical protein